MQVGRTRLAFSVCINYPYLCCGWSCAGFASKRQIGRAAHSNLINIYIYIYYVYLNLYLCVYYSYP